MKPEGGSIFPPFDGDLNAYKRKLHKAKIRYKEDARIENNEGHKVIWELVTVQNCKLQDALDLVIGATPFNVDIKFPLKEGVVEFETPRKEEWVWEDSLSVEYDSRNNKVKARYYKRREGGGGGFVITQDSNKSLCVIEGYVIED